MARGEPRKIEEAYEHFCLMLSPIESLFFNNILSLYSIKIIHFSHPKMYSI